MKKIMILVVMFFTTSISFAQLGEPSISVRDTLYIIASFYNSAPLNVEDWPSTFIIDDAVNITISKYTYKKGKPVDMDSYTYNSSWEGHIDFVRYDAVCNGKHESISVVRPREDCNTKTRKYVIGDYEFYVVNLTDYLEYLLQDK